jgi:ligand-binding sensor domain-containing protein
MKIKITQMMIFSLFAAQLLTGSSAMAESAKKQSRMFNGRYDAIHQQNWLVYKSSNSGLPDDWVTSVAIDEWGDKWFGTNYEGLTKFSNNSWFVYNITNSGLPVNDVRSIAIDGSGNKWIGTWDGGIAKFDGTNWTVYNKANSDLPDNRIKTMAIDGLENVWIGTWEGGLAKFDGTNWAVYNTSNSDLPDNRVKSVAIDHLGNKWVGTTEGGLAKFDGTRWTIYDMSNSGLPDNFVMSLAIDESDNKWIGTYSAGLAKFDGTIWTVYNGTNSVVFQGWGCYCLTIGVTGIVWIGTGQGAIKFDRPPDGDYFTTRNSGLPGNWIQSITSESNGNTWIATWGGVGVYNEQGFERVDEKATDFISSPLEIELLSNYPNPFNSVTVIDYRLSKVRPIVLKIYNFSGQIVKTLVDEKQDPGYYSVKWDGTDSNGCAVVNGVYIYTLQTDGYRQSGKALLLK